MLAELQRRGLPLHGWVGEQSPSKLRILVDIPYPGPLKEALAQGPTPGN